jgi:hypothetical protein
VIEKLYQKQGARVALQESPVIEEAQGEIIEHVGMMETELVYHYLGAFLASARTAMDMSLRLLQVGQRQSLNNNVRRFVEKRNHEKEKRPNLVPKAEILIAKEWKSWGSKLGLYRDCLVHHTHFTETPKLLVSKTNDCLSLRCPLPDNPEAQSIKDFRYTMNLDVHGYTIGALSNLGRLITDILNAVEEHHARRHPDGMAKEMGDKQDQ